MCFSRLWFDSYSIFCECFLIFNIPNQKVFFNCLQSFVNYSQTPNLNFQFLIFLQFSSTLPNNKYWYLLINIYGNMPTVVINNFPSTYILLIDIGHQFEWFVYFYVIKRLQNLLKLMKWHINLFWSLKVTK